MKNPIEQYYKQDVLNDLLSIKNIIAEFNLKITQLEEEIKDKQAEVLQLKELSAHAFVKSFELTHPPVQLKCEENHE